MHVHLIQKNLIQECFDQQDTSMHFDEFEEATGISKKDIHKAIRQRLRVAVT